MVENPYKTEYTGQDEGHSASAQSRKRPLGIVILAVLHTFGGIALLAFLLFLGQTGLQEVNQVGSSLFMVCVEGFFLGTLLIACGIGMWLGKRWGWWLASYYYVYAVVRNVSRLISFAVYAIQNEMTETSEFTNRMMIRIIINTLVYFYLFRPNVLNYFGQKDLNKIKAAFARMFICVGLVLANTIVDIAVNLIK